jgi:hypothetical protein
MFQEYNPSKKDIINSYGIDTDIKNELPKEVRFALSMGLNNEQFTSSEMLKNYILMNIY